jgi:hypothetical protein
MNSGVQDEGLGGAGLTIEPGSALAIRFAILTKKQPDRNNNRNETHLDSWLPNERVSGSAGPGNFPKKSLLCHDRLNRQTQPVDKRRWAALFACASIISAGTNDRII